jgi:hypothetical protein
MKSIIALIGGIWIGKTFCKVLAENRAREKEVALRKRLERYMRENLPGQSFKEMNLEIEQILKGI